MTPMVLDTPAWGRETWKSLPPPTIHPVKEIKFDKYIPPQTDGRAAAEAQAGGRAAIVIDNGMEGRVHPPLRRR